jgi:hypothetical protein
VEDDFVHGAEAVVMGVQRALKTARNLAPISLNSFGNSTAERTDGVMS